MGRTLLGESDILGFRLHYDPWERPRLPRRSWTLESIHQDLRVRRIFPYLHIFRVITVLTYLRVESILEFNDLLSVPSFVKFPIWSRRSEKPDSSKGKTSIYYYMSSV